MVVPGPASTSGPHSSGPLSVTSQYIRVLQTPSSSGSDADQESNDDIPVPAILPAGTLPMGRITGDDAGISAYIAGLSVSSSEGECDDNIPVAPSVRRVRFLSTGCVSPQALPPPTPATEASSSKLPRGRPGDYGGSDVHWTQYPLKEREKQRRLQDAKRTNGPGDAPGDAIMIDLSSPSPPPASPPVPLPFTGFQRYLTHPDHQRDAPAPDEERMADDPPEVHFLWSDIHMRAPQSRGYRIIDSSMYQSGLYQLALDPTHVCPLLFMCYLCPDHSGSPSPPRNCWTATII